MKLRGTRVQYGFLLHRNCFLLINMLENFIKFQKKKKKNQNFKIKFIFFLIKNFHKISKLEKNKTLCNKSITTLDLDQYEVLWSRVHTLLHKTSY